MGVRTTASFYRRGIPDNYKGFGIFASANYTIFQPNTPANFSSLKSRFKNILYL
uniref:Uncharacterized protein n=1 Tax=viral metagenome TaxID=1070528 RepID=A0A6C0ITC1_9ZZZZ